MPDRNDGVSYPELDALGVFPEIQTQAPQPQSFPDSFNEGASPELANYIEHGMPKDLVADNPAQFYTAFNRGNRPESVVFNPIYTGVNTPYLIAAGKRLVTGFSVYAAGATGPILVRDGVDMGSSLPSFVIPSGGGTVMFGVDGVLFDYGVLLDYSLAGPVTALYGGIFLRRVFAE